MPNFSHQFLKFNQSITERVDIQTLLKANGNKTDFTFTVVNIRIPRTTKKMGILNG
jgi:hypothetical protein